jgi:hypothetical protein
MPAVHQISAGVEIRAGGAAKTQRDRILSVLIQARGAWVPLTEIIPLAAQYNARLHEIRHKLGFNVENRTQEVDGIRHSWFRLISRISTLPIEKKNPPTYCRDNQERDVASDTASTHSLFGDLSPERHRDDG